MMTKKTVGFVGGGRITRIFLEGWKRQDVLPTHITVSDCNVETLNQRTGLIPTLVPVLIRRLQV
jgi:pyrroline-5-carboxylate reductase